MSEQDLASSNVNAADLPYKIYFHTGIKKNQQTLVSSEYLEMCTIYASTHASMMHKNSVDVLTPRILSKMPMLNTSSLIIRLELLDNNQVNGHRNKHSFACWPSGWIGDMANGRWECHI